VDIGGYQVFECDHVSDFMFSQEVTN